ncbi:Rad9-domain-containing protein [Cerioporus squamosus]|nr:Rad9-domain-containing protein [Cerioporus squamosus]
MQATVDATAVKHLTRALTCLSKFGEEVILVATPETLALSSTNSSNSAYGRFKYPRSFFSKYRVDAGLVDDDGGAPSISGQIATKSLLSIFRHRTNEKGCEKCDFIITDGPSQHVQVEDEDEERDSLESRLTVRLHCKHGVVKTHRLALNVANNLAPSVPDAAQESRMVVGSKTLKSLLEHFPFGKGSKSDPQLIWYFYDDEVQLRSHAASVDDKGGVGRQSSVALMMLMIDVGRPQLATELTISAEEFDEYDLQTGPMMLSFHLREFNAPVAFAEASQLPLEIRFTDPADMISISADHELFSSLFVIATSHVQSSQQTSQNRQRDQGLRVGGGSNGRKRPLDDDSNHRTERNRPRVKKPMKVVYQADRASIAREMHPPPVPREPQPSWAILTAAQQPEAQDQYEDYNENAYASAGPSQPEMGRAAVKEPLFLPSSQLSQLPPAVEAAIIESGLGIEHMSAEEFAAMLQCDADEIEFGEARVKPEESQEDDLGEDDGQVDDGMDFAPGGLRGRTDSFELVDDVEMAPTQNDGGTKAFRPLFED